DVGVLKPCNDVGLVAKSLHLRRRRKGTSANNLDGDNALGVALLCPVNNAHAAAADFLLQFIIAEAAEPWQKRLPQLTCGVKERVACMGDGLCDGSERNRQRLDPVATGEILL